MAEEGGSVTLIFYRIGNVFNEPMLNLVAAACQLSPWTHVELAIGNDYAASGAMSNVSRIFNDAVGVELTSRTGRNPQYSYLSLGCSKRAEMRMLGYARSLVGRPFDNFAMVRSLFYPRTTDGRSYFCAELVADVLRRGGLLSSTSNPGAATPQSLYKLYAGKAATSANPSVLRSLDRRCGAARRGDESQSLIGFSGLLDLPVECHVSRPAPRRARDESPPRARFKAATSSSGYVTR